jgi:hypothetical protein
VPVVATDDRLRRDGWLVSYRVDVCFDTDRAHTGYDHVGTLARCRCCGEALDLRDRSGALERHARRHERQLSVDDCPDDPSLLGETESTIAPVADFMTDEMKEVTVRD